MYLSKKQLSQIQDAVAQIEELSTMKNCSIKLEKSIMEFLQ